MCHVFRPIGLRFRGKRNDIDKTHALIAEHEHEDRSKKSGKIDLKTSKFVKARERFEILDNY